MRTALCKLLQSSVLPIQAYFCTPHTHTSTSSLRARTAFASLICIVHLLTRFLLLPCRLAPLALLLSARAHCMHSLRLFASLTRSLAFSFSLVDSLRLRSCLLRSLSLHRRTLNEFLGFLRSDVRSQDEFARVLRKSGTLGKDEYMRAIRGNGASSPVERKMSDR